MEEHELYPLIGDEGFARVVSAFYRQVPHDDLLGPMYGDDDLAGAGQRLRDFLVFRFGGPPRYIETRGHPRLRMRHARFTISNAARDRWLGLMNAALDEAGLPKEAERVLRAFFDATSTFLINQ